MKTVSEEDNEALRYDPKSGNRRDEEANYVPTIVGKGDNLDLKLTWKEGMRQELAFKIENLTISVPQGCLKRKKEVQLLKGVSVNVLVGSKLAIVADAPIGKSAVLNTILGKKSALKTRGSIKKQLGRGPAVYSSQKKMLIDDLTLSQNFAYFVRLGSANFTILDHMIF